MVDDLHRSLGQILELDELVLAVIAKTKEAFQVESSAILLLDSATDELYFPIVADVAPEIEERLKNIRVPVGQGIAGWVVKHGETQCVADVAADERWYESVDEESGTQTKSVLYAPLRGRDGIVGVIGLRNKLTGAFLPADTELIESLAETIAKAIENAQRYGSAKASAAKLREEIAALNREAARRCQLGEIVGQSAAMLDVFRLLESAIFAPVTVLIQGETGTGKELIARAIHYNGPRRERPFVAVNCGAISETLLESELFGHKKGAFTGAVEDRKGLFEVADGGTIFLDEIGDTPLSMQVKLLRALQEREITRVGETTRRKVDVRVISATHSNLESAVENGTFRSDLYYRLNAFPVRLPALRERLDDIPLLANRILEQSVKHLGTVSKRLGSDTIRALSRYDWPGNVRELQNEIQRAVLLSGAEEVIRLKDLSDPLREERASPAQSEALANGTLGLKEARERFEREYIAQAIARHDGNVSKAARALGVSRSVIYEKLGTRRQ